MSLIKHVTLQKIVAHDFRYDLRTYGHKWRNWNAHLGKKGEGDKIETHSSESQSVVRLQNLDKVPFTNTGLPLHLGLRFMKRRTNLPYSGIATQINAESRDWGRRDKICNALSVTSFTGVNIQYLHTHQFIFFYPFNSLQLWQARRVSEHKERTVVYGKEITTQFFSFTPTTPFCSRWHNSSYSK